jgi:hypothetical protein
MRAEAATVIANRDLYLAKRQELLERAQFWQASHRYSKASKVVLWGAALAAIGGIGYQLALSAPESSEDSSSDAAAAATPRTAQLVQLDTEAGRALWEAASLADCEISDTDSPTVTVIVLGGDGTLNSPYTVSTVSNEQCGPRTFPVVSDVALLVEEPTTTITITGQRCPAPTPPQRTPLSPRVPHTGAYRQDSPRQPRFGT